MIHVDTSLDANSYLSLSLYCKARKREDGYEKYGFEKFHAQYIYDLSGKDTN